MAELHMKSPDGTQSQILTPVANKCLFTSSVMIMTGKTPKGPREKP